MQTSDRGIAAILAHEGVVPAPYLDSKGIWTYGVGHTAAAGAPNPANMPRGMPADLDAGVANAFEVFRRDLAKYEAAVAAAIRVPVDQHEFDAAVSFHFNTGAIGRATWVKSLNSGNRADAAAQIMAWRKPPEIIKRRESEQRLFRDGVYPSQMIHVWTADSAGRVTWKTAAQLTPADALALMRGGAPDVEPTENPTRKENPMNTEMKSFLMSKTIWGAVIAVLPAIAGLFGYTVTGGDATEAAGHANAIVTAIGGMLAIYGRVTATAKIG